MVQEFLETLKSWINDELEKGLTRMQVRYSNTLIVIIKGI